MSFEASNLTVRSWRIALAAVLALACSQLVFAGHQHQHDADGIDEVCATCLQLEQFDHPPIARAMVSLPEAAVMRVQTLRSSLTTLGDPTPYSSRAPPAL